MLIAEFRGTSVIWEETFARVPDMTITIEEIYQDGAGTVRQYNWAQCVDFTAFEAAAANDPTVTNLRAITDSGPRRLYRVEYTERSERESTFPAWSELDVMLVEARATVEGWSVIMRFPDRDALGRLRERTSDTAHSFELARLYHEDAAESGADSVLTPAQREALLTAYNEGYFRIPREASQGEVAATLGISAQSISERIRRGITSLVESTLFDDAHFKP